MRVSDKGTVQNNDKFIIQYEFLIQTTYYTQLFQNVLSDDGMMIANGSKNDIILQTAIKRWARSLTVNMAIT